VHEYYRRTVAAAVVVPQVHARKLYAWHRIMVAEAVARQVKHDHRPGLTEVDAIGLALPDIAQKSAAGVAIPAKSSSVAGLTREMPSSCSINQYACFKWCVL
jgi:hypothetical protein